jgi:S-layer homology domain
MVNFSMKMASTVTVVTLLATTLSSSVSAASEFLPYAELLADNAVIGTQSTEAGYRLGDTVTRAELAKVAANLGAYTPTDCTGVFADVTSNLGDLCGYVEALADAGVVASATNFRPAASVTRAEMTKMLLGVIGEEGSSTDAGYMDIAGLGDLAMYINRANEMGCAADASYFRPNATASRGEAFKIAACVAGLEMPTTETPTGTGVVTPAASGSVSVALDGAAVAQYVPKNASSVKVGTIKLTAGAAATTVSSVVVTRSGLGNVSDIASLQLAQAGVAATDSRTMSTSSQSATLKFTTPLVLAAGTSASFDVLVSLAGLENNQHQFTVTAVNVVGGSATGTPVTLGLLNTTSYGVKSVTVDSVVAGSVTSGKNNQLFATVKLTPNGEATVNGFTLSKSTGEDYTKVMANLKAYHNSVMVGTVSVTSDKIVVTGMNLARLSGEQASIELKGDATYVGPVAATTFYVAESTDVSATEKSTGYIMAVSGAPSSVQSLTLSALDLTLTKMSTGSKTVAPGTSGVELLNVKVSSDATFDVSAYNLATNLNFNNFVDNKVTVYVNGVDYEWTNSGTTTAKSFSATADRFRVEQGTPVMVRVVANVRSNAATVPASYTITLNLTQVKNVSNGNTVAVTKSQAGDTVTVKNGTATFKKATVAPASTRTIFANASDIEIGRFAVTAEAENITVRKVTLTNMGAATMADFTALVSGTSVKLVDVATNAQISATVTVDNATTITLDSMSAEVLKDTTRNFKVLIQSQGFAVGVHGQNVNLAVVPNTVDKASGGAATVVATATATAITTVDYKLGVVPPTVTLTKKSASVFLVKVTNVDTETDFNLNSITARIKPVADNNSNYEGTFCLRAEGSTVNSCPVSVDSSSIGTIPGSATGLVLTTPQSLTKNGGSYSYEIYVDSNYVNPPTLLGEVSAVNYGSPAVTETYTVSAQ